MGHGPGFVDIDLMRILNQKPYSLAYITMFPKEIVLVEVELLSYTETLLTGGQTDRQIRCLKGDHSQKVMQRVEVQSQQKKACGADCMSKNTTESI